MTLGTLAWLTLIAAGGGFWWHSDRIKQLALAAVQQYCRQRGLQLLDQTMVLRGLALKRGEDGRLAWHRRYVFEFSSTGERRYRGEIQLHGIRVLQLELEAHVLPNEADSV